jgi:hypothetical protein
MEGQECLPANEDGFCATHHCRVKFTHFQDSTLTALAQWKD